MKELAIKVENVSKECGEHYLQFLRELSLKCRQNEIVLSVDNPVPSQYSTQYDLEEQGKIVDYVIIMGYDEHHSSSYESGPVASPAFVEQGIKDALEVVPANKLINAIPFYTRLWKEVEKTQEELNAEEGTDAAEYPNKVTSKAYGIKSIQVAIDNAKRRFDIDLTEEISRIKKDMNIKENGYPSFWSVIRKDFNKKRISNNLVCPMNYIFDIEVGKYRNSASTLPMNNFFIKHDAELDRRKSKKVEELIQKYSLSLYENNIDSEEENEKYLLL